MRDRTADLLRARQALSQLSYSPSMLVFMPDCCVAATHSLSHIHQYVPSLIRRAPCTQPKILRIALRLTNNIANQEGKNESHLFEFEALDRVAYTST